MPEKLDPTVIGGLLGLLAHDLRNPLSALHSNLGFLRQVLLPADVDAREAVDDGLVSCDGLAHIIDNIELLGRTLRGEEPARGAPADLSVIIGEVATSVRSMAQSHGVEVVVSPEPPRGMIVERTRDPLLRALGNLVRNAIQHSPPGATVRVSLESRPGELVVVVQDEGTSLAGELGEGAFTALGQLASKSVPRGRYSRGLGLYSAALAAAATGATVRVTPREGGAPNVFELSVPRSK